MKALRLLMAANVLRESYLPRNFNCHQLWRETTASVLHDRLSFANCSAVPHRAQGGKVCCLSSVSSIAETGFTRTERRARASCSQRRERGPAQCHWSFDKRRQQRRGWRFIVRNDDLTDDSGRGEVEIEEEDEVEELEEQVRDYEMDYDLPVADYTIISKGEGTVAGEHEGEEESQVFIDESEFHKIAMKSCDFFIRKVPDVDDNVYDFSEMYVAPSDVERYAVPVIESQMPTRPIRCLRGHWDAIHVKEEPVDRPRSAYYSSSRPIIKAILVQHYKNRRMGEEGFVLDFDNIFVIDNEQRSIRHVKAEVELAEGKKRRNRKDEVLSIRENGTVFKVVPSSKRKSADEIIQEADWHRTREEMQEYLRGFRDYEVSNWF